MKAVLLPVGALLLLLLGAANAQAAQACPLTPADGRALDGDGVQIAWAVAEPHAIAVGENFVLDVRACPADSELLSVKATMPSHRHGMNYVPSITAVKPGHWRIDGLLWHMRGSWELDFELRRRGGKIQSLRQAVELQ